MEVEYNMKDKVRILLAGVGRYWSTYLDPLLDGNDARYELC